MKKTKYYYEHRYCSDATASEMQEFYDVSKVKLYKENNKFYTYEYAGNEVSWFNFLKSEEVEIKEGVTKLPADDRYKNGYNWKTTGPNARLRKSNPNYNPYDELNKGRLPINPKTGRRDGGCNFK
jgi:hypothetical protein